MEAESYPEGLWRYKDCGIVQKRNTQNRQTELKDELPLCVKEGIHLLFKDYKG